MGDRIDVEVVSVLGCNDALQNVVDSCRRCTFGDKPEALTEPGDVRVYGEHFAIHSVHHHALGRFYADRRERNEIRLHCLV